MITKPSPASSMGFAGELEVADAGAVNSLGGSAVM